MLEEQVVKHQEQKKRKAELHFNLLEKKEKHCKRTREFHVGTPRERIEWRNREDTHASVGTRVDLRVRGFQKQGCSAET